MSSNRTSQSSEMSLTPPGSHLSQQNLLLSPESVLTAIRSPAGIESSIEQQVEDAPRPSVVHRKLQQRHLSLIAIGGTIGTGLFVGSGATIATAGPLGSLIAYTTVGMMVYFVTTSLGELAAHIPVSGSFNHYAGLFVDESLSFSLGWNYWLQWAISLPSELSAAGIIMAFWFPTVPTWVWSGSILLLLIAIHFTGVRGFGESEFWLSGIKVVAIVVFIVLGILIDAGLLGDQGSIGFANWRIDGAPIKNGVWSIFNVVLIAFFSFGGTELIGVTAGEAVEPHKTVPEAIKKTFWRIVLFYIVSIFIIGLIIPNDDPSLLDASVENNVAVAPFTLVFRRAGLASAAHIMNGVILSAVLSASSSAMYAASRTLMSLAISGNAPAFLGKVNDRGVPYWSLLATAMVGSIAFLGIIWGEGVVFSWLLNVTGISGILTWLSISLIHIRFRRAFQVQSKPLSVLPYQAPFFPYGPYIAIFLGITIIFCQGYAAIVTIPFKLQNIVAAYIGIPFFLVLFVVHKLVMKTSIVDLAKCDLGGLIVEDETQRGDI